MYTSIKAVRFLVLRSLILLLVGMMTNAVCQCQDWPQWMGPNQSGVWSATGTVEKFAEGGPPVKWREPIGGGYAGPAVVGDRLYVMDRRSDNGEGIETENNVGKAGVIDGGERVRCMSVETGETIWDHTYQSGYNIAYPTGPRCTPPVDGEHVYTLGAMGRLICFRTADGEIVWEKHDLADMYSTKPPLWGYASHPIVDGDNLIVPVGGKGSGIVAFNKLTGEEVWKSVSTFDIGYAPLVIYESEEERQLIFWHGAGVTSVDPATGKEFWTVKFPNEKNASVVTIATPKLIGNQLLIAEYYKGALLLEIGSDPPSVNELWRSHETDPRNRSSMNCMMATPVIKDGHAYGVAYDARGNGVFRCTKLETGEEVWTKGDWLAKKPVAFANAFIVENGDKYFVFNDLGELMICRLSPEGFEEVDRAHLLEPTSVARGRRVVWSHPAFAGSTMFVRNDEEIIAVDLTGK